MNGLAARSTMRRARGACHTCGVRLGGHNKLCPSRENGTDWQRMAIPALPQRARCPLSQWAVGHNLNKWVKS
jgi:hypothetical protein